MRRLGGILGICLLLGLTGAPSAHAQTGYFVTIAARVCDRYIDIAANKSRNNLQESLRDLGPDTPYTGALAGVNVNPAVEGLPPQDRCRPLVGWKFKLGQGIAGSHVNGPWGSLSVVSSPYGNDITTQDAIYERNDNGDLTTRTIAGATEVELSLPQLTRAQAGNLWIQGGTEADPVLDKLYPGAYAFGALRCATDNVNGDNVEYIRMPTKRVYCFAYYVQPPPTAGTIVIRKQVTNPPNADMTFAFGGNLSFTPDHRFSLQVSNGKPAAMTFYRGASNPADPATRWTADELVPDGWRLTGISCPPTAIGSPVTIGATGVTIELRAGDTVTCTFTDELAPPPGLALSKVTLGGVGTFPFSVRNASSAAEVASGNATTTAPGTAATVAGSPFTLPAGVYSVSERLPRSSGGTWHQSAYNCNATLHRRRIGAPPTAVSVTITNTHGAACVFENTFVPTGSITVLKQTQGGAGTTGFVITALDDPARQYLKTAKTITSGEPALARGDSTRRLPLGTYAIQETRTVSENPDVDWELVSVDCGGRERPFSQGGVEVTLTAASPRIACRFVNFAITVSPSPPDPRPEPTPPPVPLPEPAPTPPAPVPGPQPDLVVTKRALQSSVRVGELATFTITVRNAGDAAADQVAIVDTPDKRGQFFSAHPSRGSCNDRTPMICRVGTIAPGAQVTVRIRMRAVATPAMADYAVAGSASRETLLRNNVARAGARVRVVGRVRGGVRGRCASAAPVAHAAC